MIYIYIYIYTDIYIYIHTHIYIHLRPFSEIKKKKRPPSLLISTDKQQRLTRVIKSLIQVIIANQEGKGKNRIESIPLININLASTKYKALSSTFQPKLGSGRTNPRASFNKIQPGIKVHSFTK